MLDLKGVGGSGDDVHGICGAPREPIWIVRVNRGSQSPETELGLTKMRTNH